MKVVIKQINNKKVKKVKVKVEDNRPIKGSDLVTEIFAQIFIVAKKNSGKSTALANLIPDIINKTTKVFAFCKTIHQDDIWKDIKKNLKKSKVEYYFFDSIIDDRAGVNHLDVILDNIQQEKKKQEEEDEDEKNHKNKNKLAKILFEDSEDEDEKTRKSKYRVPENLFIFDDISGELKNSALTRLLKTNRHFKSKVIISSQYPYDLLPESRKNIDLWLLFKGETDVKLFQLHKDMDSELNFDQFYQLYKKATEQKYSFFYCDARLSDYRINFDKKFFISD